jgi:hypothetical protein
MMRTSHHAARRTQQRGINSAFLAALIEHADTEAHIGDHCVCLRVTRQTAMDLGNEKLAKFAVIWSANNHQVVSVLPIIEGARGRIYRRGN